MGDKISIKAQGDVAFAKGKAIAVINKRISESAKITDKLGEKLKELSVAVDAMIRDMQDDKAKEVTGDLGTLVEEAAKDKPREKWYHLSAEGLIDAAKTVGAIGEPVIRATQSVLKLLAP